MQNASQIENRLMTSTNKSPIQAIKPMPRRIKVISLNTYTVGHALGGMVLAWCDWEGCRSVLLTSCYIQGLRLNSNWSDVIWR